MRKTILAAIALSAGLFAATSSANAAAYTFTQIDVPGGFGTAPAGINSAGQIVGSFAKNTGLQHGFLETGGSFTPIDMSEPVSTCARGINDTGQIVGSFGKSTGLQHGFLDTGGSFTQ